MTEELGVIPGPKQAVSGAVLTLDTAKCPKCTASKFTCDEHFPRQAALDRVWRGVDALGGAYTPEEHANGYAKAHGEALDAALAAIEALGGRPS